jgi:hypothetical protein
MHVYVDYWSLLVLGVFSSRPGTCFHTCMYVGISIYVYICVYVDYRSLAVLVVYRRHPGILLCWVFLDLAVFDVYTQKQGKNM